MGTDGEFFADGVPRCKCGCVNLKILITKPTLFVDREQGYDMVDGKKVHSDADGQEYGIEVTGVYEDSMGTEDYEVFCKKCNTKLEVD
jgi:hypothetical protein